MLKLKHMLKHMLELRKDAILEVKDERMHSQLQQHMCGLRCNPVAGDDGRNGIGQRQ